ncbi:TetR/AcrR family transcriptional regulator [Dactylosporangium sp. NPDC048998]|uniref:TetR/AcrR family transcriptional regulator n=1 Tax=Dactylosporangium sp. NPDC048998 TaxID=3363976 RepID=UPI0037187716
MGNREKLLEGAQRCLLEKGYAATTARDIAAAAGVSLAAINYHFRTTEALLNEALRRALDQWSDELERALTGGSDVADPGERFVAIWDRVIASVAANRSLWTTQFEVVTQLGRQAAPESPWAAAQVEAEAALAALFHGIDPAAEPELARAVGGLYQALLAGVVVQHLVAPERAMSGRDLALALRAVCERLAASGSSAAVQKV